MTWKVFEEDSKFCVFKTSEDGEVTGKMIGSHATREEADAQVATLNTDQDKAVDLEEPAQTAADLTVKALGQNRIGGYAVLWGDAEHKDLTEEWFTSETEELMEIFKGVGALPWLYNHAADDTVKSTVMARVDTLVPDSVGLWYEAQKLAANQYSVAVDSLVKDKLLGTSTQTYPNARKVAPSGFIERWPIIEVTGTPSPAESRMRTERPIAEIKAAYKAIGLELPDERADDKGAEKARQTAIELEREAIALLEIEGASLD